MPGEDYDDKPNWLSKKELREYVEKQTQSSYPSTNTYGRYGSYGGYGNYGSQGRFGGYSRW